MEEFKSKDYAFEGKWLRRKRLQICEKYLKVCLKAGVYIWIVWFVGFKAWIIEVTAADLVFLVNWLLSAEHELLLNYEWTNAVKYTATPSNDIK